MGGAQATGTAEDTVVVYTPSVLDNGIYMSNITLPQSMFWSDVIEDPSKQRVTSSCLPYLQTKASCMCDKVLRIGCT